MLRDTPAFVRACEEIANRLLADTTLSLTKVKLEVCRKYKVRVPSNADILSILPHEKREKIDRLLRVKPIRAMSGIMEVTVMVKPHPCGNPLGKCTYCPGYPISDVPSAYTGREPACMRAIENDYDPYAQVKNRMDQLRAIGHVVDKVELIILGGTFTALPIDYQDWFVKRCLDAITGIESSSLREAIANAEVSEVRNSNMCTETRPDCLKERHIDQLLKLGMTRIELGVQTIYDDVYKLINRGHKVQDVVEAERHAKDSGFATIWHMMPALPGSNLRRDADMFQRIFDDPRFRPDMLKIYPCLVMDGTKLHKQWTKGEYEPYTLEEVIDLLAKVKARLPNWVRIMRIQRDIPSDLIRAGVKRGNLRQLVKRKMDELGLKCRCVRCREVGLKMLDGIEPDPESVKLKVERYEASGGVEFFLSFEDVKHDVLIGLLRLRSPSEEAHRKEVKEEACAIVRQLQVYGPLVKVGESPSIGEWQHRGYGRTLIEEGERIAREELDAKKVLILSGLGVRRYYRKLGYTQDGPYISKRL